MVLGQCGVVLVGTSVLGDTGPEQGGTGCRCDRVAFIVTASQPGWEEMENLRGNLRKFERK